MRMAMEQQAADEDEHGQTMQRLLGKWPAFRNRSWQC